MDLVFNFRIVENLLWFLLRCYFNPLFKGRILFSSRCFSFDAQFFQCHLTLILNFGQQCAVKCRIRQKQTGATHQGHVSDGNLLFNFDFSIIQRSESATSQFIFKSQNIFPLLLFIASRSLAAPLCSRHLHHLSGKNKSTLFLLSAYFYKFNS